MSFWMGLARGFKDADDKKTQDRRILDERAYDASVREDSRKFEKEMFWTRIGEERRTALLQANASRSSNSPKVDPKNEADLYALAARLDGVEGADEFMAEAVQDPSVATSILETIRSAEQKAAENGIKGYRISGQQLIDNFQIFGPQGVAENLVTVDEILNADLSNPDVFAGMMSRSGSGNAPARTADFDPSIFYRPDREGEKYTAGLFDDEVLRQATLEASRLAETDAQAAAEIMSKARLFGKEGGALETQELRDMFGEQARETLRGFDSTQSVDRNPGIPASSAPPVAQPPTPQTPEAAIPSVQPSPQIPTFATEDDARAALTSGTIKVGDTVIIGGRQGTVQ
jgi:hypothetical protein